MDLKAMMDGSGGRPWTEERHSSFLNWMEESFVRRMLAGADLQASCSDACDCRRLPLDRYLPDSATESTRDCHSSRRSAGAGAGRPIRSPALMDEEEEPDTVDLALRSARKRPLPRYDASQDQVVPRLGSAEVDDNNSKNRREGEGECLAIYPTTTTGGRRKRGRRGCDEAF